MGEVALGAGWCSGAQGGVGVSPPEPGAGEGGAHPRSKAWYLLRAQALQTVGSYLSLDVSALPPTSARGSPDHGLKTADTALGESMKWLCSLVVTLLGTALRGGSAGADARLQWIKVKPLAARDNVLLKWQVLSEVLSCSLGVVAVRSHCGTVPEAKARCLEALKLATKLQTLSHCAELLVAAELELQMAELELSGMDLEQVEGLLDLCTDFGGTEKKAGLKIKAQKGRLPKKASWPWGRRRRRKTAAPSSAPGLPASRRRRAGSAACRPPRPEGGPSAGSPPGPRGRLRLPPAAAGARLGRVVVRWAAARPSSPAACGVIGAEGGAAGSSWPPLSRASAASARPGRRGWSGWWGRAAGPGAWQPFFLHDLTAKIYLRMALRVEPQAGRPAAAAAGAPGSRWSPPGLRARLALRPELALVRAGLLAPRPGLHPRPGLQAGLLARGPVLPLGVEPLASPKNTSPRPSVGQEDQGTQRAGGQEAREPAGRTAVPKLKMRSPPASSKPPKPPGPPKSASTPSGRVPRLRPTTRCPDRACTPVPKVRAPRPAVRRGPQTGPNSQFRVYDESSLGGRTGTRARRPQTEHQVEFSEESDGEADAPAPAGPDAPALKTPRPRQAQRTRPAQTLNRPLPPPAKPTHAPPPQEAGQPKKSTAPP
ncbi:hypothetical protein ANANG_G00255820 [Anguilla anguilla]|uniref:Uncharacterized protein n=1 Tax=Anguilla anguilla TaxID=7936 RepID=A0A9D3LVH1_ANGAN|nr:hypothetical protein ANANG_G00255820 [Anguilla anguilla]